MHTALHRQPMQSLTGAGAARADGKSAAWTIAVPCGRPGRLRASRSPISKLVPCSPPRRNRTIWCSSTLSPACRCSRQCGTLETAFSNCFSTRARAKYPTFKKKRNGGSAGFSSAEHHDRDINAAKSLMAARLAVAAWGARVRPHPQKRGRHLAHNIDMMLERCLIQ